MIKMYEVRDSKDSNLYSLEEMVEMFEDEPVNYSYVSRRLCCPHCLEKNVKIQIDDYFERITSKKNEHLPWCDYYGQKLSQREIKKLLTDESKISDVFNEKMINNKVFPKRNIERYLSADDFGIVKLFYGTVSIREAYSKNESKYKNFAIKAPKGEIINISFSKEFIKNNQDLIMQIENNLNETFEIKFIANLYEIDDYVNATIEHENFFKIIKILSSN